MALVKIIFKWFIIEIKIIVNNNGSAGSENVMPFFTYFWFVIISKYINFKLGKSKYTMLAVKNTMRGIKCNRQSATFKIKA